MNTIAGVFVSTRDLWLTSLPPIERVYFGIGLPREELYSKRKRTNQSSQILVALWAPRDSINTGFSIVGLMFLIGLRIRRRSLITEGNYPSILAQWPSVGFYSGECLTTFLFGPNPFTVSLKLELKLCKLYINLWYFLNCFVCCSLRVEILRLM